MYKNHVRGGCVDFDAAEDRPGYAETDPSGRFGRFRDVLGKGAMKTVYRAFDETLGMEVAWNQVKLHDIFRSPDELERLYSEVHLLKNLRHKSIIKFYSSWIDAQKRTFNFITEMFTSGTLREYRLKYRRVSIQAVKNWARQILHGIVYLHSHDPPVIHRDLKCDNIFVNGHLAQVKIGDLGLAAILRDSHQAHSVIGTPEFMAPELYEEEYNELVDVYSFGMCMLEMLTCAYPYSECSNPAQIYKKVTSGKLPESFYRIQDHQAREFIGKCLETVSKRPSARELLMDPFLATSEVEISPIHQTPKLHTNTIARQPKRRSTDMTITGTLNSEHDTVFLKVQISDTDGPPRNVYFPFDIVNDTAIDVATEMVQELAILEWEPFEIARMIEDEIESLVPNWKEDLAYDKEQESSFNYHEGTNDSYYDAQSSSSSQASLPPFNPFEENVVPARGLPVEAMFIHDDASSQSSLNSHKYSNVNYSSDEEEEEDEYDSSPRRGDPHPPVTTPRNRNSTRFCPDHNTSSCNDSTRKITSMRSLMDVRSQLLHKSLVEEISKRRMFKTVGCVESIGFQEPCGLASASKGSRGREKQRYK